MRGISRRTSLRTKLITAVLGLVIAALATISVATIVVLRSHLTTQYDSQIAATFTDVYATDCAANNSSCAITSPNGREEYSPGYLYGLQGTSLSNVYVGIQIVGSQLSWPSSLSGPGVGSTQQEQAVPGLPTASSWAGASGTVLESVQSGSQTWRIMAQTVTYNSGTQQETGTLVVAVDLGNINAMIRTITAFDIAVSAAIVLVLTIVGVGIVRTNLRPLEEIEETAEDIAAGHLDRRVPESDPRTEVGSLAQSLNIMLSQIETAFRAQQESEAAAHQSEERMRRFVADASHELRTPLTAIRGFAEYYRQRGGVATGLVGTNGNGHGELSSEDLDRIMHRVESEASRMGLLVEDLLLLARLDQQRPLDIKPIDLLSLAADAVQDARMIAPDRSVELEIAPGAAFIVDGDEARLRQVIGNLMNNALTHTPAGTPVTVRIGSGTLDNGRPAAVLDVADQGPGLTEEQAQRVFERFYRADAARTRVAGGSGLGLAIVASLVAAHGGDVGVKSAPGQGATFRVRIPLVAEAHSGDLDDEDSDVTAY
ncbi:MAG: HAMP domain-containing sensor histidine kinase [Streptosporangiaceae bacterium]|jgi:two-component system OmpR family sensor kinase